MPQFVITNAGITAIIDAGLSGPKIEILNFKFGSAVNYTPLPTDTALNGSVVGTLAGYPISGYAYISPDVSEWKLIVDENEGNFQFGEVGLYIDDPSNPGNDLLFAKAAFPSYVDKLNIASGTPNRIVINARCAYTNLSPVVNYQLSTMYAAALVELPGVHALVPPGSSSANQYLCHTSDDSGKKILVYKNNNDEWSINDFYKFVPGTVTVGTNTQLELTSTDIGDALDDAITDFAAGRYLVQFTSGPHIGMIREITSVATDYISWGPTHSLSSAITVGTTFDIYISDYYLSKYGDVPKPATPADDNKVLTASGGSYGWVTATTVPVPANPTDDYKFLGGLGGSYSWRYVDVTEKTLSVGRTGVAGDAVLEFHADSDLSYEARIIAYSDGKLEIAPLNVSADALLLNSNVQISDSLLVLGSTTLGDTAGDTLTVRATPTFKEDITGEKKVILKGSAVINAESASEGGKVVLAYPNITGLTGEANSTWNVEVDSNSDYRIFRKNSGGVVLEAQRIDDADGYTYGVTPPDDDSSKKFATTEWVLNQNNVLSMLARDAITWVTSEPGVVSYYIIDPLTPYTPPMLFLPFWDRLYTKYMRTGQTAPALIRYTQDVGATFSYLINSVGPISSSACVCPDETCVTYQTNYVDGLYIFAYRGCGISKAGTPLNPGFVYYTNNNTNLHKVVLYSGAGDTGFYGHINYLVFNRKIAPNNVHLSLHTFKNSASTNTGYSTDYCATMSFHSTLNTHTDLLYNIYVRSLDRFRALDINNGEYLQSTDENGTAWSAAIPNNFGDLDALSGVRSLKNLILTEEDVHIAIYTHKSPPYTYRFVYSTKGSGGLTWVAVHSGTLPNVFTTGVYVSCAYSPTLKRVLFYNHTTSLIMYSDFDENNDLGPFVTVNVTSPNTLPEHMDVYWSTYYNRFIGQTRLSSNYLKYMMSADGVTWGTYDDFSGSWETILWASGSINKFVMASQDGFVSYSSSLESWTRLIVTGTWFESAFSPQLNSNNGQIVIVGTNDIKYSPDASTWSSATGSGITSNTWTGVDWSNEQARYLAVANSRIAHSTNGTSWVVVTPSIPFDGLKVVWCSGFNAGNGYWVALSTAGVTYRTNDPTLAAGWTANTVLAAGSSWRAITYSAFLNRAVAVGNGYVAYTDDGINWTLVTDIPVALSPWESATWSNTLQAFYVAGNGKIIYSVDGILWNSYSVVGNWQDITYSSALSKLVAATQNKIAYSKYGSST